MDARIAIDIAVIKQILSEIQRGVMNKLSSQENALSELVQSQAQHSQNSINQAKEEFQNIGQKLVSELLSAMEQKHQKALPQTRDTSTQTDCSLQSSLQYSPPSMVSSSDRSQQQLLFQNPHNQSRQSLTRNESNVPLQWEHRVSEQDLTAFTGYSDQHASTKRTLPNVVIIDGRRKSNKKKRRLTNSAASMFKVQK